MPYNRDILGVTFAQANRGGKPPAERGHWLLVQGQSLLVTPDLRLPEGDCQLPLEATPFWLGIYHDAPLWVVPVAGDAALPAKLKRETLVPIRGDRLPHELLSLGEMAMHAPGWEAVSEECR